MAPKALRITVIGGGSVGLVAGASLALAGAQVTLTVRAASVAALRQSPLVVRGMLGDHHCAAGQITIEDTDHLTDACIACDVLVVTTKAYDVTTALAPFAAAPIRPKAVLLMQNGLGSADAARAVLGPAIPIYSAVMRIGMERVAPTEVTVSAYAGPVQVGSLFGDTSLELERLLALGAEAVLPMQQVPNIKHAIFGKLLVNSCLNPTGALLGFTYGGLLENGYSRRLIIDMADETLRVLGAVDGFHPYATGKDYVEQFLQPVIIQGASEHRSSMVQDIAARRRTEIDYLNGAIVKLGREVGVATPVHQAIVALIKARE